MEQIKMHSFVFFFLSEFENLFTVKSTILFFPDFNHRRKAACKLESDSRTEPLIFSLFPLQAVQIPSALQGGSYEHAGAPGPGGW